SESSIIEVNFRQREHIDSVNYLAALPRVDYGDIAMGRNLNRPIDLAKATPMLTFSHELNHFASLFSTPFGLYVWRLQQALSLDLQYLCFLRELKILPEAVNQQNIVARASVFESKSFDLVLSQNELFALWDKPRSEAYANFLCWEIAMFDHFLGKLI